MEVYFSLLVCLIGLVLYLITGNATPPPGALNVKTNVLALHMFWVGLFVFLLQFGHTMTALLPHVR
jgi:hypothetical protein